MREILFKAKGQTDEKWHIGFLAFMYGGICIIRENEHEWICQVDTLCQYTGLTDKNGKKIWENDVVLENSPRKRRFKITYDLDAFCIDVNDIMLRVRNARHLIEVIGNIFDNPDLVEGGAE